MPYEIMTIGWIAACGLAYYYRGRGIFAGRVICGLVWSLPILFVCDAPMAFAYWALSAALTWASLGIGHGSYMDLGRHANTEDNERLAPLMEKFDIEAGIQYDALGLLITGIINVLPPIAVLAWALGDWTLGLGVLLCGAVKPLAYELGWRCWDWTGRGWGKGSNNPVAIGEAVFGTSAAIVGVMAYSLNP